MFTDWRLENHCGGMTQNVTTFIQDLTKPNYGSVFALRARPDRLRISMRRLKSTGMGLAVQGHP